MRVSTLLLASLLVFASLLTFVGELAAAELQLPQVIRPGELFVANLVPDLQTDKQIRVRIDTTQLQFMGAVQGTPDLQINGDAEFDIRPESGNLAAQYGLRFLSLQASGSAMITYTDNRGEHKISVTLTPLDASRGYSWLILAVGLVLLIVGVKLWRYQKTAPEMMSTKSLFMNYEELEKARKMYFPEEPENASKTPAPVEEKKPSSSATAERPVTSDSGTSTSKQKAVQTVNIASRLAQYGEDDDKPAAKVLQSQSADPADPADPAEKTVAATPVVSVDDSALLADPAVDGESTVPVMSVAPADASTVPVAKAVPESSVSEDSEKTRPVQHSLKAPAVEPPKPKIGMAPVVGQLRKDTGERVIRLKMVFAIEDEKGRTYEAESEIIKIGRHRACQIVLTASEISREHVEIFLKKSKIMVKPLTTTNICRLNNNELKKAMPITPGDKLNMGGTEFLVTKARSI